MLSYTQGQLFIFFFIIGMCIGIIYDIFRVIRKNFKTKDFVTQIEDVIFLIFCGALTLISIIELNNGEVRFYLFIAIFLGILLYFLTFSKVCVIIINVIVKFCKNLFKFILKIIKILYNIVKNIIKKHK